MKNKNKIIFNLIFIFTVIFSSTVMASDTTKLPMKNLYHELDIVDADEDSFGVKIKNINDRNLYDLGMDSIKINNDKLELHSYGLNDLNVEKEIEINGKYIGSVDEDKEKEIDELLESRKNQIIESSKSNNTNWFLIVPLFIISLLAIAFTIFYKKLSKLYRGMISLVAFGLMALSLFFALSTKTYYPKFDKIKFSYTDKDGNVNKFYGLLNYKIEGYDRNHERYHSSRVEYFESNINMQEEVETKNEEIDFKTIEKTSDKMGAVVKDKNGDYKLNKQVSGGEKGKKTFEEVYVKVEKDNNPVSRDLKSKKLIKEVKAKDKLIITGTRPVRLKEKLDYDKIYKSDLTAEVGTSKIDYTVKAKHGEKLVTFTYNTETKKIDRSEKVEKPKNEVVLVGVIKYVTDKVDFEEEIVKRDDLPENHRKVIQEGKPGKVTKKYSLALDEAKGSVIEDINKAKLLDTDTQKPVNQIIEIGTKKVEAPVNNDENKPGSQVAKDPKPVDVGATTDEENVNEYGLTEAEESYLNDFETRFTNTTRAKLNALRSRNKLNQLNQNSVLEEVAKKRNIDNINNDKFAHEYSINGVLYSAKQDASNLGYAYPSTVGENISVTEFRVNELNEIENIVGSPEFYAEEIIHNYYEDPGNENLSKGHRKAMLSPIWLEAGYALEIRAVKESEGGYKVKIHGAQIFGVGRVLETQEDVDMFNYFRSTYQTDKKHFVPTVGLETYESYLERDNIGQYFKDSSSANAFRQKSIAENKAFKNAISSGEANLESLKNYADHKAFFEDMKTNGKVYN